MSLYRVKSSFKDKLTGDIRQVGELVDITPKRAKAIKEVGDFITPVELEGEESRSKDKLKTEAKTETNDLNEKDVDKSRKKPTVAKVEKNASRT